MIAMPVNDEGCLTKVSYRALDASETAAVIALAETFATTAALARWIRSLPQRNDQGDPDDGPKVECDVSQRVRIPADDPNCVERAAMYLAIAESIDPRPVRQLATMLTPFGRHTFAVENDVPVHLDPAVTRNALEAGMVAMMPPSHMPRLSPKQTLAWTLGLAQEPVERRYGSRAFRNAAQAGFDVLEGKAVSLRYAEMLGTALAWAEREARMFGVMGLDLLHVTLRGLEDVFTRSTIELSTIGHSVVNTSHPKVHSEKTEISIERTGSDTLRRDPNLLSNTRTDQRNASWNLARLERAAKIGTRLALPATTMAIKIKLASWGIPPQFVDEFQKQLLEGTVAPSQTKPSVVAPTSTPASTQTSTQPQRLSEPRVVTWGMLISVVPAT